MPWRRNLLTILGVLLLVLLALSGRLYQLSSLRWSVVPISTAQTWGTARERLFEELSWLEEEEALSGRQSHILDVLTNDRSREISIYVAEGRFTSTDIEPANLWYTLIDRNGLLVNSVDEHLRKGSAKSISHWIADGCNVNSRDDPVQLGQIVFEPCRGQYQKMGIRQVANAAIVISSDVAEQKNCRRSKEGYEECMDRALDDALRSMFNHLRATSNVPQSIVLPAMGTGFGRLSKSASYSAIRDSLLQELKIANRSALPSRIVLQVYRGEEREKRRNARYAISHAFGQLHDEWLAAPHTVAGTNEIANSIGIVIGLVIVIAAVVSGRPLPIYFASTAAALRSHPVFLVLGWGFAALGAVSLVRSFLPLVLDSAGLVVEVCIGVVAVLVSILLLFGRDRFSTVVEHSSPTDKEGQENL